METIDDSSRVQYVTKRGRNVKLRKDLFEHYEFLQTGSKDQIVNNISMQGSLKQGLKYFPKETRDAALSEFLQLNNMKVFEPVDQLLLLKQEILGTLNTLTFIKKKRCGRIKARTCADGRPQRNLFQKWEASSPTIRTKSVLFTSMLDAYEGRAVGVYDIPGAFLHAKQTDLPYVRMTDDAAKLLIKISPDTYKNYMISEREKDVIYLMLKKVQYGYMKSALLFWENLSGKLIERGYKLNPYDSFVANKTIMTTVWHVDDLMDMHFINRKLQVSMVGYLHEIVDKFPFEIMGKIVATPAAPHPFDKDKDATLLDPTKAQILVAKVLWDATRAPPDLLTTLSYLTCQVKAPDEDDMSFQLNSVSWKNYYASCYIAQLFL